MKFFNEFLESFKYKQSKLEEFLDFTLICIVFGRYHRLGVEFFDFISKYDDFISKLISIGNSFSSGNTNSLKELEESIEFFENFIIENNVDHEDENNYWDVFNKEKGKEEGQLAVRQTTLNDFNNTQDEK